METFKVRGVVLHQVKYSETSLIVKIYTDLFGLQTYIAKGVRSPKSRIKAALFQPLTLVDMVVYHNQKKEMQHIREICCSYHYKSIPYDIKKTTIALFVNEMLYKSIHEELQNRELFNYIFNALVQLDEAETHLPDFHLVFAMHLTRYLGFYPHGRYSSHNNIFDMMEGVFKSHLPDHTHYIEGQTCVYFDSIINPENSTVFFHNIPSGIKKILLEKIIDYYGLHISVFGKIRSHLILEEVLHG